VFMMVCPLPEATEGKCYKISARIAHFNLREGRRTEHVPLNAEKNGQKPRPLQLRRFPSACSSHSTTSIVIRTQPPSNLPSVIYKTPGANG